MRDSRMMEGNSIDASGRLPSRLRIAVLAAGVALILLIPLIAMQFSDEWNWNLFDFIFAGTLLFGAGLTYEVVAKKGGTIAYRVACAVAIVTALLLVWVNAAVGIIGDDESANILYLGVLVVGIAGALVARFRPPGMARTLFAMAVAQLLVPVVVLMIPALRDSLWEPPGIVGVFILNTIFALLWIGSAWLFRKAARENPHAGALL